MGLHLSNRVPPGVQPGTKAMMFVDGENLAIRLAETLGGQTLKSSVKLVRDVYVWSWGANDSCHPNCEIIRRYYYTATQGDHPKLEAVETALKRLGVEAPRVFKKQKGRRAKRVDIQLSTDMLGHAHRGNYDIAILVAGDEDYVPLVEAVQREGRRVAVWFFEDGLSPALFKASDHAFNIRTVFVSD